MGYAFNIYCIHCNRHQHDIVHSHFNVCKKLKLSVRHMEVQVVSKDGRMPDVLEVHAVEQTLDGITSLAFLKPILNRFSHVTHPVNA